MTADGEAGQVMTLPPHDHLMSGTVVLVRTSPATSSLHAGNSLRSLLAWSSSMPPFSPPWQGVRKAAVF